MRRLFWLAVGAGMTGVAVRRANKLAHAVTSDGVAQRFTGVGASVREFTDDVRAGMLEREVELRDALGLDGTGDGAGDGDGDGRARAGGPAHGRGRRARTGDEESEL